MFRNIPEKEGKIRADEVKKRRNKAEKIMDLKDSIEKEAMQAKVKLNIVSGDPATELGDLENNKREEAKKEVHYLTNDEILKRMRNFHDEKLDEVDGIGGVLKEDAIQVGDELGLHNEMLDGLNRDVDKVPL